jgi:sulfite reductase (ferredoxin)
MMHDLGAIARTDMVDGEPVHSFDVYVGGGLGTTPHQAKLLADRVPLGELLPITQAVARVFARLGEKLNRNRARIKFLVAGTGIEEFQRLVREEREILPYDERWTAHLEDGLAPEVPSRSLDGVGEEDGTDAAFVTWRDTNAYLQRQDGYAVVTVPLPLGDISSHQSRLLADIARRFVGDTIRTTVEQNIVFRWVRLEDLRDLYAALGEIGMADAVAETIVDVTSCPGTDTCKLGISASRGLAGELRDELRCLGGGEQVLHLRGFLHGRNRDAGDELLREFMISLSVRITGREFQCVRFLQVAAFAICGGDAGGEGFRPLALAREIASRTQRPTSSRSPASSGSKRVPSALADSSSWPEGPSVGPASDASSSEYP